jgi:deoxyribodipyrimidine photo-lyase
MSDVPPPEFTRAAVVAWVDRYLGSLVDGPIRGSTITGGYTHANAHMAAFDVAGYARERNEVWPIDRRGASGLSPYIRHGLLQLPRVWREVAHGPPEDVRKFRDELLWQEYARHVYARIGAHMAAPLRYAVRESSETAHTHPWHTRAACVDRSWQELTHQGWITNQQRMWLASHWQVRHQRSWREGEDLFFRSLLDGSRAANRLGWQWVTGGLTGKSYGFSQSQVRKRAPGLCESCDLTAACPIADWPAPSDHLVPLDADPRLRADPNLAVTTGPNQAILDGEPDAVWLTAESLGDDDPALKAHSDTPAYFIFDEPLLNRLRLSAQRLIFLTECLADLATRREVRIFVGDPLQVLAGRAIATTFAPVPGFRSRLPRLNVVSLHPWPWLVEPHAGSITSFSAWSKGRR